MQFKFPSRICLLIFITIMSMGMSYSIWGQTLTSSSTTDPKAGVRYAYVPGQYLDINYKVPSELFGPQDEGASVGQVKGSRLIPISKAPQGDVHFYLKERYGTKGADYSLVVVERIGQRVSQNSIPIGAKNRRLGSQELDLLKKNIKEQIAAASPAAAIRGQMKMKAAPGTYEEQGQAQPAWRAVTPVHRPYQQVNPAVQTPPSVNAPVMPQIVKPQ